MSILLIILIVSIIYLYLKYVYSYWNRMGFPYCAPTIPWGNLWPTIKRKKSFGFTILDLYNSTTEPLIGIYLFFRPSLLIRDPELVKNILVKDFLYFHDRGIYSNEEANPLSGSIFSLTGLKWKNLRNKLSPTFSSGKLKGMFPTILNVGIELQSYLEPYAVKEDIINMKEFAQRYSIDIIASVIFGYEVNTIQNPNNNFKWASNRINNLTFKESLESIIAFLCPKLIDLLKLSSSPKDVDDFMIQIVKETIDHREKNNVIRKDFMQLLIQLRNSGEVQNDDDWNINSNIMKSMTIEQCAAQVFLFYIAGNETTASTVAFTLYELGLHPEILKNVQSEIDDILEKYNGQITYESIQEGKYLDACVNETMRKYPGLPFLNRECTNDYEVPGTNMKIPKGTGIVISLMGLHRDENNFHDANGYVPERFIDKTYNEKAFLPFGEGPRMCIAIRMGLIVTKVCLILLLSKYNFEAIDKAELKFDPLDLALNVIGGINLKISKRKLE